MKKLLLAGLLLASSSWALTVKDAKGDFTLDKTPERIVALEFSFVDALANVGVSPVGIADDNEPDRLLPAVRENVKEYQSVGTRSQPNLEVIANLKPDLIIADLNRHSASYDELRKIAPVVIFNSRYGSYDEILEQSQNIADLVGKGDEMRKKIADLNQKVEEVKKIVPAGKTAFVAGAREDSFNIHSQSSYTGALLTKLGFKVPAQEGKEPIYPIGLEQVVALNPDVIFVAVYRDKSITDKWAKEALWQAVNAVKAKRVFNEDENLFARARGLYAARGILDAIQTALSQP